MNWLDYDWFRGYSLPLQHTYPGDPLIEARKRRTTKHSAARKQRSIAKRKAK